MKRGIKWLLGTCGTLLVLLAVAIVLVATFDWNRAKPWVNQTVTDALGRTVAIDGDLQVGWYRDADLEGWRAWVPTPHVSAGKVTVGNSAWAQSRVFGTAERVDFDLALLPLLTHRVSIQMMRFLGPNAAFERAADGRENWTFTDVPSTWHCDIGRLAIDKATFTFVDDAKAIHLAGHVDALDAAIAFGDLVTQQIRQARSEVLTRIGPKAVAHFQQLADKRAEATRQRDGGRDRYAFAWTATGTFRKQPFNGSGKLGGVFYLRNSDRPFPLQGDVRIGDTHIVLVGTLTDPVNLDALDLRVWLAGPTLSHLYDIANLPMPNSPPYAMEGHFAGRFTAGAVRLRYENFTARIGQSDMSGSLLYEGRQPRPLLSGKIDSDELQFLDLAPLIGASAGEHAQPDQAKLIPATPFRPERWRVMDADVEFTGDHVFRDSELPIHKVDTRIVMNDAVLSLQPLKFRYAWGDVDATLRFDGRQSPIDAKLDLTARGMQLKHLFAFADNAQVSLGRADGEATLTARGESIGALLGAANGHLKLLLDNGTVSKALLETAGLNLPNMLVTKLFGDRQVKIDCAAANLVATSGVFTANPFVIDTDVTRLDVTGTIDLGRETVDLVVHPDSKSVRVLSLHSPLHVRGPFRNVDVSIDKGALLARAASAIGLAALAAPAAALVPLTSTSLGSAPNRCESLLDADGAKAQGKAAR